MSKSELAVFLSRLERFTSSKLKLEQYETDSEIAAEVLWQAFLMKEIENRTVADLGAGTGILGIAALKLGAKKVFFVEKDEDAIDILKRNLKKTKGKYEIICSDIADFDKRADIVIQNPPFGTKTKHADKPFLEKAFSTADIVYSFHKESTESFIKAIAKDNNFKMTHHWKFDFPLKQSQKFHKKRIQRIQVGCWRLEKNKKT
ncbi:MAG: METTL5 family protein [Nanoarchaeota archaeon]|nr:METTL5 family protein [Nanoarchaeota archaeon]